ncbi:Hypothetical protein R9X50_00445400 [Acrodontium crateriforme]|uniref:C2H2-type domain-containing protein n=1 Tax=Acrodontium crateriforme TaxID=150365 RepID=A0AAQ3RA73_9PEZI|nr:Hypothetical protein R9X50_00445400 [Acrodontium crateriforme]
MNTQRPHHRQATQRPSQDQPVSSQHILQSSYDYTMVTQTTISSAAYGSYPRHRTHGYPTPPRQAEQRLQFYPSPDASPVPLHASIAGKYGSPPAFYPPSPPTDDVAKPLRLSPATYGSVPAYFPSPGIDVPPKRTYISTNYGSSPINIPSSSTHHNHRSTPRSGTVPIMSGRYACFYNECSNISFENELDLRHHLEDIHDRSTFYPASPVSQASHPMSRRTSSQGAGQFVCLYESCVNTGGFTRYADLQRHVEIIHMRSTLSLFDCQIPGCHRRGEYGFTRKDKMTDHMRDVHKLDIPKRSSGTRRSS